MKCKNCPHEAVKVREVIGGNAITVTRHASHKRFGGKYVIMHEKQCAKCACSKPEV